MTDYHLVTFTCLHFKLLPQHDDSLDEANDTSKEALFTKPITSHQHSIDDCGLANCATISYTEWTARVDSAVGACLNFFSSAIDRYFELSYRYHGVAIGSRATTIGTYNCRFAHEHFGVERKPWREDDFFQDWLDASEKLRELDRMISSSIDEARCRQIVRLINKIRVIISGCQARMLELEESVVQIENVQEAQRQTPQWSRILYKPSIERRRSGRRDTRALRGATAPAHVFSSAVYFNWRRRVQGVWNAYRLK